jgi:hypothetical protein
MDDGENDAAAEADYLLRLEPKVLKGSQVDLEEATDLHLAVQITQAAVGRHDGIRRKEAHDPGGEESSVSGGANNAASGVQSSVTGGLENTASGEGSSVSDGLANTANAGQSAVSGGADNTASGDLAWVGGGFKNNAEAPLSSIFGGKLLKAKNEFEAIP